MHCQIDASAHARPASSHARVRAPPKEQGASTYRCRTTTRLKPSADGTFSRGTTSTTTSCCDIDLVQLAAMHRLPAYYNNYDAVRDRRGRTTRADAADAPAALHRLMD